MSLSSTVGKAWLMMTAIDCKRNCRFGERRTVDEEKDRKGCVIQVILTKVKRGRELESRKLITRQRRDGLCKGATEA